MKRNALVALLVAVSATVAGLATGSPAAADPECRYQIIGKQYLRDDTPLVIGGVGAANPYWPFFGVQQPKWSVLAIRPPANSDYDLKVEMCPDHPPVGVSVLGGSAVDFLALDGSQSWNAPAGQEKELRATVSLYAGPVAPFMVEYSVGGPPLHQGAPQHLIMRGPALVRDVYVGTGQTVIVRLRLFTGDADLAVMDPAKGKAVPRVLANVHSVNPGLAEDRVAITVPANQPGRMFGVVVINNAGYGEYELARV
jgi:hypothetical protein